MQTMHKITIFVLLAVALLFLGCASPDTQQSPGQNPTPQGEGGQNILTVAVYFKGPVEGAAINIYSLNTDGSKNELLAGPVQTDEEGKAYFKFAQPSGRFLVESTGGAYYEDTGRPASEAYAGHVTVKTVNLPSGYTMRTLVPIENDVAAVTPFTEMAAALALHSIRKGASVDDAARAANIAVDQQYRQANVIWYEPAPAYEPARISISIKETREYGLLLAGMVEEARTMKVEPAQLAVALAEDWSDGNLDGKQDGKPINLKTESGSPIALSASASLAGLQAGINAFLASPVDATNIKQFPIAAAQVSTDPSFYIDATLPAWIDGQPGSYALTATGGKPAYTWKLKKGNSLPAGFSLSPDGKISGTGRLQNSVGSISPPFTIVVSDSSKPPQSREMELRIEIMPEPPKLEVQDAECEVGTQCNVRISSNVIGGTPPYHYVGYSSDKGQYPLDLVLWADGTLRGTPSTAGTFAMQACVIDLIGWEDCQDFSIYVSEKPTPEPTTVKRPPSGGEISCTPGHHAVYCDGRWRCCLNGWVCNNDGDSSCGPG
ncbi:TPA: DUF4198 domain-containing protein [Candidatus Micrarchaeota archaeon]|nr:DUF4198 domain-containing protein [Candidatus Micrarchaeota archaeon]